MLRKIIAIISGLLIGAVLGIIIGLLIGAYIGGNYMTSFQFNGVQGYEATGQIGAIIEIIIGPVLGIMAALKLAGRGQK